MILDAKATKAIALASKYFVASLAQCAFEQHLSLNSKSGVTEESSIIDYDDLSSICSKDPRLTSIKSAVPRRMTMAEALKLREMKLTAPTEEVENFINDITETKSTIIKKAVKPITHTIEQNQPVAVEKTRSETQCISDTNVPELGPESSQKIRRSLETMSLNSPLRPNIKRKSLTKHQSGKFQPKITNFFTKSSTKPKEHIDMPVEESDTKQEIM